MFRFIYAARDGESVDSEAVKAGGFHGVECVGLPEQAAPAGVRIGGFMRRDLTSDVAAAFEKGAAYVELADEATNATLDLRALARQADEYAKPYAAAGKLLLLDPRRCRSVRDMWQVLELATCRNLRIAWSSDAWTPRGLLAVHVVPVLNLRLGLARVSAANDETIDLAKRLAGIGYQGYFVIDPAAEGDRFGAAREILEAVRKIVEPPKPAKKAATPR